MIDQVLVASPAERKEFLMKLWSTSVSAQAAGGHEQNRRIKGASRANRALASRNRAASRRLKSKLNDYKSENG